MIKKLLNANDNLLSFLCGIFSNIPISILFAINKFGKTVIEHVYFFLWLTSFVLSVALTCFAFMFTLRKFKIQKMVEENSAPVDKEKNYDKFYAQNRTFLFICLLLFFITAVLLVMSVIGLWVLANYIGA